MMQFDKIINRLKQIVENSNIKSIDLIIKLNDEDKTILHINIDREFSISYFIYKKDSKNLEVINYRKISKLIKNLDFLIKDITVIFRDNDGNEVISINMKKILFDAIFLENTNNIITLRISNTLRRILESKIEELNIPLSMYIKLLIAKALENELKNKN